MSKWTEDVHSRPSPSLLSSPVSSRLPQSSLLALHDLERTMRRLKDQLVGMLRTVQERDEKWRRVIEDKLKENKLANEQLAQCSNQAFYSSEIENCRQDLTKLTRQTLHLNQALLDLANQTSQLHKINQAQRTQLQRTISETRKAKLITAANNHQLEQRCKLMQVNLEVLEERKIQTGKQLEQLQQDLQSKRMKSSHQEQQEQNKLKISLEKSQKLQESLRALQNQFKQMSDAFYQRDSALSNQKIQIHRRRKVLEEKQSKARQLQEQLEKIKTVEVGILKLQQTLQQQQQNLKAVQASTNKLRFEIQEGERQLIQRINASKASARALEERRSELKKELESKESQLQREERKIKQTRQKLKDLQQDQQEEKQMIEGLVCAIEVPSSKPNEHSLSTLEKELSKLTASRLLLDERNAQLLAETSQIERQQQQYKETIAALESQISSYKAKLQSTNNQLQSITFKNKQINLSIEDEHRKLFLSVYQVVFAEEAPPDLASDIEKIVIAIQQKLQKQLGGAIRKKKPLQLLKKNKIN